MKRYTSYLTSAALLILAMSTLCWGPPGDPPPPVTAWGDVAQWTILGGAAFIGLWRRGK